MVTFRGRRLNLRLLRTEKWISGSHQGGRAIFFKFRVPCCSTCTRKKDYVHGNLPHGLKIHIDLKEGEGGLVQSVESFKEENEGKSYNVDIDIFDIAHMIQLM